MTRLCLLSISCSMVALAGCGSEKEIQFLEKNEVTPWVERLSTPESEFSPVEMEAVLDDVVAILNTEGDPGTMVTGIVPKHVDGFFAPTISGAVRAAGELGIVFSTHGLAEISSFETEDILENQQQMITEMIEARYEGFGIAPMNNEIIPMIDSAVDEGLTVVTFDSDEPESKRQFYVGTDNHAAGRIAAESLLDLVSPPGTVIVLGYDETAWTDGKNRTDAAVETLEEAGFSVNLLGSAWDEEEDLIQLDEALESAEPQVVGMLGMFSNSYLCADAAEAAGLIDDIVIAAFDFESRTLQYLSEGKIAVTHGQRQYYMGYLLPYLLVSASLFGVEETKEIFADLMDSDGGIDTGLDVVLSDKVSNYKDYLASLGIASYY